MMGRGGSLGGKPFRGARGIRVAGTYFFLFFTPSRTTLPPVQVTADDADDCRLQLYLGSSELFLFASSASSSSSSEEDP